MNSIKRKLTIDVELKLKNRCHDVVYDQLNDALIDEITYPIFRIFRNQLILQLSENIAGELHNNIINR
jgi:hypothetical protein